jgi:adenylate cyclase
MRGRFLVRLRPTLLTTVVGLVLLTALALGGSAAFLATSVTRTLIEEARTDAVNAAREEARQLFSTPPRIVTELAAAAHRGALPMENRERLAAIFSEILRVNGRLAFIGYGNVEGGWYVGAGRSETDAIVEYAADPKIDGSALSAFAVAADGTRAAVPSDMPPYFVATRPWFQQGLATPGPVWSPFYKFAVGFGANVTGITCMNRFAAADASTPTGVFHADLRLRRIVDFLSSLRVGKRGAVFLVDRDGKRVVTPHGKYVQKAAEIIDQAAAQRTVATQATPLQLFRGDRLYEVVFAPVPTEGDIGLMIGVVVDLRDVTGGAYLHAGIAAGVALVALLLAMLAGRALSSRIARPIIAIAGDLAKVGAFSISRDPAPKSFIREVDELGASVDRMKASLRSFAHYVPTDLVRTLLADGREAELGGEIRRLTIFFSDVADFTAMSEGMEPSRLVAATGRYLALMTGALTRHGGTVDKFMGDGIMAFFNAPEELPGHPRHACLAALEAQRVVAEMAAATPEGEPVFHTRMGLGLGEVLVGNIGTPERFAYTLLGDEVNLASRLEGLNKLYGTAIIASGAVMEEAGAGFEWRRLDRVAVRGRHQGTAICELLGAVGTVAENVLAARDSYERGLDAYFAGEFELAAEMFNEAARLRPGDLAATLMGERAFALVNDPPTNWDGIHVMEEK